MRSGQRSVLTNRHQSAIDLVSSDLTILEESVPELPEDGLLPFFPLDRITMAASVACHCPNGQFFVGLFHIPFPMSPHRPTNVTVRRSRAGLGLFAATALKKGETIIEYIGKRIPSAVADTLNNSYIFTVNRKIDIDGSPRWNTARYANHSCRPNCESVIRRGRVFIVARKNIAPGEELTYDYGKDFFNEFIKPFGCKCVKCLAKPVLKKKHNSST